MAQFMKQIMQYLSTIFFAVQLLSVLGIMGVQSSQAQSLKDPTKPPNLTVQGAVQGDQLLEQGPQLQSIFISDKKRVAMINGESVRINGRVGDQVLVKIEENFVVLKRGRELTTLKLYPEMQKKPANARHATSSSNSSSNSNSNREVKQTSQEGKQK
jgi:MSHA biogenesis protein MshK